MYEVVIHKKVSKELKQVPETYLRNFSILVNMLKTNPVPWRNFDIKKIKGAKGTYRVRMGDYRLVYFVDRKNLTIHVLKFERRETVY
ncbi:MAG: type II toxin-antitoxin system RelE family toxin [Candidatus Methanospirareceae archaeon]